MLSQGRLLRSFGAYAVSHAVVRLESDVGTSFFQQVVCIHTKLVLHLQNAQARQHYTWLCRRQGPCTAALTLHRPTECDLSPH